MRPNLQQIRNRQHGVFTVQQALTEYTRAEIRTLLSCGEWTRVFQGVFRETSTPISPSLSVEAARQSMGATEVAACYETAAALHTFPVLDEPATHVLSADARMTRRSGLVVHRDAFEPEDLCRIDGTLATSAARTAIDLARTSSRLDAIATLDLAWRRNVLSRGRQGASIDELKAEADRQAGRRGIRQAIELLGLANWKAESPMESRTRLQCIDGGLPHPEPQVIVWQNGIERRIDLGWPEWKIGLDYESGLWHTGDAAASRDNPRHNWLIDYVWLMFYAVAPQVYCRPFEFVDPIRRAIDKRIRASA
ncbi:hypothetical protein [Antrihabitans stalactiti]|uniref:DUF559 domain-containing protein n=1 Tax=Antrihabitans stalactiti TaxID=2584121 RepID=A0A848KL18_9NOCA|nr:hypothetical protein [Antrihabitans stalactiti]NMN98861.1 hypothetical protein [Antrihabitans stalactiti]